jgi:hypothetical protein
MATMTTATICIPRDIQLNASFCERIKTIGEDSLYNNILFLSVHLRRPGVIWRGLRPCLMQAPKSTAKQALTCLLDLCVSQQKEVSERVDIDLEEILGENHPRQYFRRRLRIADKSNSNNPKKSPVCRRLLIWIQPPSTTYYETYFSCILNTFEHRMILYQSLAAWCSTLGGGHFFCRHLATAVSLAQRQRQIALLMGDYNMAYKCTINEAYSYIYVGKFSMALKTIDSVAVLNRKVEVKPLEPVIVNMCKSARLFCKRFRKASKQLAKSQQQKQQEEEPNLTADDYQRVRIVQDQSAASKKALR